MIQYNEECLAAAVFTVFIFYIDGVKVLFLTNSNWSDFTIAFVT